MNLIDKKLKEKFMLFDNIDNEININNNKQTNKPKNNTNHYNDIYCNFILSQYNKTNNIISNNNNTSNKKKQKHKLSTNSTSPTRTHKNQTPFSSTSSSSKCCERLYNYATYLRNKLEDKRQQEYTKIKNESNPHINKTYKRKLPPSSSTGRNSVNNTPKYSSSLSQSPKTKTKSFSFYSNFTYKPSLNKNSIKIAKQLEPSLIRLTSIPKRKPFTTNDSPLRNSSNSFYYNKSYSVYSLSPLNKNKDKNNKHCDYLYNHGIMYLKQKKQQIENANKMKEEEYKQYPYKPAISHYDSSIYYRNRNNDEMYNKNCTWKKRVENKKQKMKEQNEQYTFTNCTFTPNIEPLNVDDDEIIIKRNINQINDYVCKRRDILLKQKEYDDYKNKKLGSVPTNYVIKPTMPKEFTFQTDKQKIPYYKCEKCKYQNNVEMFMNKEIKPIKNICEMDNVIYVYNSYKNSS